MLMMMIMIIINSENVLIVLILDILTKYGQMPCITLSKCFQMVSVILYTNKYICVCVCVLACICITIVVKLYMIIMLENGKCLK